MIRSFLAKGASVTGGSLKIQRQNQPYSSYTGFQSRKYYQDQRRPRTSKVHSRPDKLKCQERIRTVKIHSQDQGSKRSFQLFRYISCSCPRYGVPPSGRSDSVLLRELGKDYIRLMDPSSGERLPIGADIQPTPKWLASPNDHDGEGAGSDHRGGPEAWGKTGSDPSGSKAWDFVSQVFVVSKKDGSHHPVVNVKPLNATFGNRSSRWREQSWSETSYRRTTGWYA